jgi:hypothetical protein
MRRRSRRYYLRDDDEYTSSTGDLLPSIIGEQLEDLGYNESNNFRVWINPLHNNGIDLVIWHNNELILAGEILNWNMTTRLSKKRKRTIVSNLSKCPCRRVLIYSTMKNEDLLRDFGLQGISLLKIGYQVLTEHYYERLARKDLVKARRVDSEETRQDIKSKLLDFLRRFC